MKRFVVKSLAAATLGAAAISTCPADAATPVSGALNLAANSRLDSSATPTSNDHQGWVGAPTSLSAHVSSNTAEVTFGRNQVSVLGLASADWASADAGSVQLHDQWRIKLVDQQFAPAAADLTQNRGGDDWSYTFTADRNGAITLSYNVSGSGDLFGLWGWGVDWSGPGGGLPLPISRASDPTASGAFTRPLVAGQTYTIGLNGNPNIQFAGPPVDWTSQMDGAFSWSISAVPEPAIWALMIGGFGLVGLALRHRRIAFA